MKTAIVIGATGLVGTEIINQLIENNLYTKIIVLVRNDLKINNNKIEVKKIDFDTPDSSLIFGDELFCCLGTTIKKAGSKEAFLKVDYSYVVNIAKIAFDNGVKKASVISAMGANHQSTVFYNQTKGKMEQALKQIGFDLCVVVRPSLLLGNRTEFRFGEVVGKYAMLAFNFLIPLKYKAIHAKQVAKAMITKMNSNQKGFKIYENDDLLTT